MDQCQSWKCNGLSFVEAPGAEPSLIGKRSTSMTSRQRSKPNSRNTSTSRDARSRRITTPLLREGVPIGVIFIRRTEVRPFSEKQIALLKTFADQAVIAIENVRLFQELQARTRELVRSVEELQALGEVGQAVSSTLDLPTVLSTIVRHAVQLSGTDCGIIYEFDEPTQEFHLRASYQMEQELVQALSGIPAPSWTRGDRSSSGNKITVPNTGPPPDHELPTRGMRPLLFRLGYQSLLAGHSFLIKKSWEP